MTPVLVKALIGAGAATAVVSSGAYGIYHFSTSPKTVKEQLLKEYLELLNLDEEDAKDKEEWVKKVTEHKKTNQEITDKFDGLDLNASPNDDESNIKKWKQNVKRC